MNVRYHTESRQVRRVARQRHVTYTFSAHADDEMEKDRIDWVDIRNICRAGNVSWIELVANCWRLTVMGVDSEGAVIAAVVVVDEDTSRIHVITAWKRRDRRR